MLTAEEVRAIVREENLRLLRVLLTGAQHMRLGYVIGPGFLDISDDEDVPPALLPMRDAIVDYREGR